MKIHYMITEFNQFRKKHPQYPGLKMSDNKNYGGEVATGLIGLIIFVMVFAYGKGWFDSSLSTVENRHKNSNITSKNVAEFKKKLQPIKTQLQYENFDKQYRGHLVSWNLKVSEVKKSRDFYIISITDSNFYGSDSLRDTINQGLQIFIDPAAGKNNMDSVCGSVEVLARNADEENFILQLNPGDAIKVNAFISGFDSDKCFSLVDGLLTIESTTSSNRSIDRDSYNDPKFHFFSLPSNQPNLSCKLLAQHVVKDSVKQQKSNIVKVSMESLSVTDIYFENPAKISCRGWAFLSNNKKALIDFYGIDIGDKYTITYQGASGD